MAVSEFSIDGEWQSDQRSASRWLASHALRHKGFIAAVVLGAIGNAVLAAAGPVFTGQAFDAVTTQPPDLRGIGVAALLILVTQLVRGLILQLSRNASSEVIGQHIERDIRDELYRSLIGKSMSFHDSRQTGDLMARATNDVREVNLLFNPGLNLVIGSANFVFMPIFFAPGIHPQLIVAPLVYLGMYGALVSHYLRQLRPAAELVRRRFGETNTQLAEAIEGIETVKGAAQEKRETTRFLHNLQQWRDAYVSQADIEARFLPLLLLGILHAAGFLHSLWLFNLGQIDVGDVVAFNGLLLLFGFPTFTAQFAYSRVSSGLASARRILELITARTPFGENPQGHNATMEGRVEFRDVWFCYETEIEACGRPDRGVALESITFSAFPGQTVAIVGQTGSGKSTLVKLINRTYDVDRGQVLVDGVDVRDWNLEALRRQISVIEQDVFLFSRSIVENIAFGAPNATGTQIEQAAREAQAHDFVMRQPDGYEQVIGERGVTLSGGQRQRLALARAFLTKPAILILDDSTSAIDSETEDRIQRAIERVAAGRTTFLITHRLSQIRWADQIIVLRQGRVAAAGTHEDLLRDSSAYRNIFSRYDR